MEDAGRASSTFYLLLNHMGGDDSKAVVAVAVDCRGGAQAACNTKVRTRELSQGFAVARGTDGTVIVQGHRQVACYRSFDSFFEGAVRWSKDLSDLPADPEQSVVAAGSKRTAIVTKSDAGFYSTIVVQDGTVSRRALFAFPKEAGTIEAAAFAKDRLLLSIFNTPIAGEGRLTLWDCPANVLDPSEKTVARICHVYQAPQELKSNVAMATRDLSSLFGRSVAVPASPCGDLWVIGHGGWLWLLDGSQKRCRMSLPSRGIGPVVIRTMARWKPYRARRVDHVGMKLSATTASALELTSLPQLKPK